MKSIFLIICCYLFLSTHSQSLCGENQVSTNPSSPLNPTLPDNQSYWLNSFNWFDMSNGGDFNLTNMDSEFNLSSMTHPYSLDNPYPDLILFPLEELDMYPEQGWELFAVNLGFFPNGDDIVNAGFPMAAPEVPFLMLYNKRKGILRLFANSQTGLLEGFETVILKLEFANYTNELSGIFRLYNGVDQALDQNTSVTTISSIVKHPNNPSLWFYSDFQMAFDPCSCMSGNKINLSLIFSDEGDFSMTSRSIFVEQQLWNNGNVIPSDFLTGTNYTPGFETSGIVVYNSMQVLIDQYLQRLDEVEQHNAGLPSEMNIKFKKLVLNLLKMAGTGSIQNGITGELASQITQLASGLIQEVLPNGSIKISEKMLEDMGKSILGFGLDFLNKEWVGQDSKLPTPTKPMATISETTYDGLITEVSEVSLPGFMVPGSYPNNGYSANQITPLTYPVYNEVLGTFSLLVSPEVLISETTSTEVLNFTGFESYDPQLDAFEYSGSCTREVESTYRIKISELIRYAINPALHLQDDHIKIEGALLVMADPIYEESAQVNGDAYSGTMNLTQGSDNHELNNLVQIPEIEGHNLICSSPFVEISLLGDLIMEFNLDREEVISLNLTHNGTLSPSQMNDLAINYPLPDFKFALQLKLNVFFDYGEGQEVQQLYTYNILDDHLIFQEVALPQPNWSLTSNPINSEIALEQFITFPTKIWESLDVINYPSLFENEATAYAWDEIFITGNQSQNSSIEFVEFVGVNEILVQGDVLITGDFNLKTENFPGINYISNPKVSQGFLDDFCFGNSTPSYQANLLSRNIFPTTTALNKMNESSSLNFKVFPNPTTGVIYVDYQRDGELPLSVQISDLTGRVIREFTINLGSIGGYFSIDVSDLSRGAYFFSVIFENTVKSEKIVIQ